jgi:hypothetical protein
MIIGCYNVAMESPIQSQHLESLHLVSKRQPHVIFLSNFPKEVRRVFAIKKDTTLLKGETSRRCKLSLYAIVRVVSLKYLVRRNGNQPTLLEGRSLDTQELSIIRIFMR